MSTETDYIKVIKDLQDQAFKRGQQDIIDKIMSVIPITPIPQSHPLQFLSVVAASPGNPFRSGTESAAVYEYIKTNPGQRGIEIIRGLKFETKTVRTALNRLKNKYKVAETRNGRWFIKQSGS